MNAPHGAKRVLDVVVSAVALAAASPIMVGCAVAIRATMGAPVLFRQTRPGYRGQPFELLKFRTMSLTRDAKGEPLQDSVRLTPVGRFLRKASLDELPQLWNVLRGEMSLVGPRPLLMKYLPRYTPEQARRHDVMPGITGWAAVHGRNALSWDEKFALDAWYVDHQSFALDLQILALTAWRVLRPHGTSAAGHATMPEFMGSPTAPDGCASGKFPSSESTSLPFSGLADQ